MARLLWVDDEEGIREVLDKFLSLNGFDYLMASNATDGLMQYHKARIENNPFALLVLDIAMVDHTGLWLAKRVRDAGDDVHRRGGVGVDESAVSHLTYREAVQVVGKYPLNRGYRVGAVDVPFL